jgi:hypothetical protein
MARGNVFKDSAPYMRPMCAVNGCDRGADFSERVAWYDQFDAGKSTNGASILMHFCALHCAIDEAVKNARGN